MQKLKGKAIFHKIVYNMASNKTVPNKNLKKVVVLCYEMLELADHGDQFRNDSGCGVVYGALRDAAYKVKRLAEKELEGHESLSD